MAKNDFVKLKNPRTNCQMIIEMKPKIYGCIGTTITDCTDCVFYKPNISEEFQAKKVDLISIAATYDKEKWQILTEALDHMAKDYDVRARLSQRDTEQYNNNLTKARVCYTMACHIFDRIIDHEKENVESK